jgi:two-component system response regulator VanR
MRVLIVEDEPYLAEAVRDGLRLEAIAADVSGGLCKHFEGSEH